MHAEFVPFTAQTRMSGVDIDGQQLRKGAGDAIIELVKTEGGSPPPELQVQLDRIGGEGGTPLAVSRAGKRDPLRNHLQRARDPGADPVGAARRALPPDRRLSAVAARPLDMAAGGASFSSWTPTAADSGDTATPSPWNRHQVGVPRDRRAQRQLPICKPRKRHDPRRRSPLRLHGGYGTGVVSAPSPTLYDAEIGRIDGGGFNLGERRCFVKPDSEASGPESAAM